MFAQHFKFIFAVLLLLLAAMVTGCTITASPAVPGTGATLNIIARDHSYEMPGQIGSGWITISMSNEGQEAHHAQLVRLNDGVTPEQFQAALQQAPDSVLSLVTLAGGPGVIDPGGSQTTTTFLDPGTYLLICVLPDAQGVPHIAQGMIAPLQVVAADGETAAEPVADAEVRMIDFSFTFPAMVYPGEQIWKVIAESQQPHELLLIRLNDGATLEEAQAWFHQPAGPPPFSNAGGLQGIDAGEVGYLHLNLQPGTYVALCHIPDPGSGKAHLELGMMVPFTVQ
jgi:uncharacterized cupredoxin-like copper-binding protein